MIRRACAKARQKGVEHVAFVVGDAARLPFSDASFDAVSCSHAMYELSPEVRDRALREAIRVLRPGGRFVMMEHCEPSRPLVRFLYRVRLSVLGSSENRDFARDEVPFLGRYFADVTRELSPKGRSKLIFGNKRECAETAG